MRGRIRDFVHNHDSFFSTPVLPFSVTTPTKISSSDEYVSCPSWSFSLTLISSILLWNTILPLFMMAISSQNFSTVSRTCELSKTVAPCCTINLRLSLIIFAETGSIASRGSSRTSICGLCMIAPARDTFFFIPAEYVSILSFLFPSRSRKSRSSSILFSVSLPPIFVHHCREPQVLSCSEFVYVMWNFENETDITLVFVI